MRQPAIWPYCVRRRSITTYSPAHPRNEHSLDEQNALRPCCIRSSGSAEMKEVRNLRFTSGNCLIPHEGRIALSTTYYEQRRGAIEAQALPWLNQDRRVFCRGGTSTPALSCSFRVSKDVCCSLSSIIQRDKTARPLWLEFFGFYQNNPASRHAFCLAST